MSNLCLFGHFIDVDLSHWLSYLCHLLIGFLFFITSAHWLSYFILFSFCADSDANVHIHGWIEVLQLIQNAAARLIFNVPRYTHTTPLLTDLHWLPVIARIKFKTLVLAYVRPGFHIKYNIRTLFVEQKKFCGVSAHTWPATFQASKY